MSNVQSYKRKDTNGSYWVSKLQTQGHKWVGVCVLSSIYNMRFVCLSEKRTLCHHLTIEESTLWGRWQLHKCLSTTSVHPRSRITYHSPCYFSPWALATHPSPTAPFTHLNPLLVTQPPSYIAFRLIKVVF